MASLLQRRPALSPARPDPIITIVSVMGMFAILYVYCRLLTIKIDSNRMRARWRPDQTERLVAMPFFVILYMA